MAAQVCIKLVSARMMVQPADFTGDKMGALFYVGTVAAVATTSSFIPQVLKIMKQGGEDLSYPMLILYLFGTILWLAYGILLHAAAVIWANAITGILVTLAIALKMNYSPQEPVASTSAESSLTD
jgi:MtN3 and saliva related transmembrane protein